MINLITKEGEAYIKEKIDNLKNKKKPEIIKELKKSRELGDLSENSEYQSSKNSLIIIDKKIKDLEIFLSESKIINPEDIKDKNIINFSATILLENLKTNEKFVYKIVSNEEINMKKEFISLDSPMGRSLIGKKINDIINIKKLNETVKYKIISIKYI